MQVLKFGGTSVANAGNMNKVIQIIREAAQKDKTVVVISALGGITDTLLQCGSMAAAGNETYKEKLQSAEQRHLEAVKQLIPVTQQSSVLSLVKKLCNEIEDVCNGIFLLGELSPRTIDRILSYGELISSQIVSEGLRTAGISNTWKDSRELIITDSMFTHAVVDFKTSNQLIHDYFSKSNEQAFYCSGFCCCGS